MTLPQTYVGVDIAKGWIDVFYASSSKHEHIVISKQSLAKFVRSVKGCLVVLEASGGYERPVTEALADAGVEYARVNPRHAREFARATGQLAKTDKVDAQVLARMGRALDLAPTSPLDKTRRELAVLVARREDLVTNIGRENNRLDTTGDAWVIKQIQSLVRQLQAHRAAVDARIADLVANSEPLTTESLRLISVKGIGPVVAAVLMARLPELSELDHRQLASLAGLAPHARDSGLSRGKRQIWGGRADVRRALYIAAKSASQWDPVFKAFRKRLTDAGKPLKTTIVACARKLLTILAAMFRRGENYRKPLVCE